MLDEGRKSARHLLKAEQGGTLNKQPDALELGGKRQDCSFVFTDLTGFTTWLESMDPAGAVTLLNDYLDGMVAIAFSHQGTLDRIVGDAVVIDHVQIGGCHARNLVGRIGCQLADMVGEIIGRSSYSGGKARRSDLHRTRCVEAMQRALRAHDQRGSTVADGCAHRARQRPAHQFVGQHFFDGHRRAVLRQGVEL